MTHRNTSDEIETGVGPVLREQHGGDLLTGWPSVNPSWLGVIGFSRGAELSLLLASLKPDQWRAVVAISPSSAVWEGGVRDPSKTGYEATKMNRSAWSLKDAPVPFLAKVLDDEMKQRIARDGPIDSIESFSPALEDRPNPGCRFRTGPSLLCRVYGGSGAMAALRKEGRRRGRTRGRRFGDSLTGVTDHNLRSTVFHVLRRVK